MNTEYVIKSLVSISMLYLALAPAWCQAAEPKPYRELLVHCKGLDNSFRCARAIETAQTKGLVGKYFERANKTLQVNTARGPIDFRDDDTEGDDSVHYSYLAFLPSVQLHVLHVQYWEGNVYKVVHQQSGATAAVDGFPNPAPGSRRFVSVSSAGEAGYDPNSVEIWRVREGSISSEFRHEPDISEWSPEGARWINSSGLKLSGRCFLNSAQPKSCSAILRQHNRQWELVHVK